MNVFLFHCWGGDGRSCWGGWLQDELRVSGLASRVLSPDFPNTETPRLDEWLTTTRELVPKFAPKNQSEEWILIGHSLGCPTILRLLETFEPGERVKAVILVAGFAKDLGIPQIKNFVDRDFDWKKISSVCDQFVVINSDNDPFIGLEEGKRIAKLLNTKLITEHGAGHINEGSGYKSYPRLLEIIKQVSCL